jgi:hypothetical protein
MFKGPHRRPYPEARGFAHLPSVFLLLQQRRAASRRRTGLGTTIKNVRTRHVEFFAACAGGAANDSNSSKEYRRENFLTPVHIQPVSPPRVCAFFISATTLSLPFFRLTSLRVCAGAARLLCVLEGRLSSLSYHLQVLSPTTKFCNRHQQIHVLQGETGIAEKKALGWTTDPLNYGNPSEG